MKRKDVVEIFFYSIYDILFSIKISDKTKKAMNQFTAFGGDKGIRTLDPLRARQVLSQLSYTPVWWTFRDSNPGPTGYEPVALTN